ncbi:MAG: hypothetical protein ACM3KL_07880, partial [Alphaproteobacteria bacterium]
MDRKPLPNRLDMVLHGCVMRRIAASGAVLFFLATVGIAIGQQDDPSEIFLQAYLSAQQAEKLEHQNQFKTALAKYRFAGSLIEELRRSHSDWQPAVVEYRGRKISEGILRLQNRITRQTQLNASSGPLPEIAPAAPETDAWSEPGPELLVPQPDESLSDTSRDTATKDATKNLRDKVDQLQAALDKTRGQLESAQKEKDAVDTRLKETNSKLEQAQADLDQAKKSEHQTGDQPTQSRGSSQASGASEGISDMEREQLQAEIAKLQQAVVTADEARATAEKQRDETQARFADANNHIVALERERDDAVSQLKSAKETEQRFQAVVAEKNDLHQKLATAEEKIKALAEAGPENAEKLTEMTRQMTQLQQQ